MKKIIILKGLPASGKTTWARQQKDHKRVNKDDLRAMIDNSEYSSENEELIKQTRNFIIHQALTRGYPVIVDDTNFNPKHIEDIKVLIGSTVKVEIKTFDTPLEECIERDKARANGVGEQVIRDMYEKYCSRL